MKSIVQVRASSRYPRAAIALAVCFSFNGFVFASEPGEALVPSPSILDFTDGDGWGVVLGGAVEYEAAYDGSDEYEVEIEPAGAVQWRSGDNLYYWEGMELGWRGLVAEQWLVQAGIRYESGLEPDDSDEGYLDGLSERDSHTVGFLEFRRALDPGWRNWVAGRLMGGPSDFGWLGVIAAGHRFGNSSDGSGTEVFGFATFGTDDFINKDFGVGADDSSTSGLPQYELDSGYRSIGLTLVHRRDLSDRWHLIVEAGAELYSGDISDSPIARNDYEAEVGLTVVYRF